MKRAITSTFVYFALAVGLPSFGARADSLRFTSGSVSTNCSTATLSIAGPTNLVCQIERLNPTNDVWETQGIINLGAAGSNSFAGSLIEGIYGFFRTKATNNSYYSTNAYGAICGFLDAGDSFIGNPFLPIMVSKLIPQPPEGIEVLKYVTGSGWVSSAYADGAWGPDFSIGTLEGIYVRNGTNQARYVASGIFGTNTITKTFTTGFSAVCLPLYHIHPTNTWINDTFNSSQVGGVSGLPVQSAGFNPQCTLYQLISSAGLYSTNILTTNNVWQHLGTNTVLQFKITDGFFIDKPTNATWTVNRTIW